MVRLVGITRESIWLDEAGSLRASQHGLSFVFVATARDTTPPLYFLGLHTWLRLLPDTDALIRGYSVLWSVAGGLALCGLAGSTGGRNTGLLALGLLACNPLDIYYAQEARMYAQVAALATTSSLLLWLWLKARREHPGRSKWLGPAYAAAAAAVILTHYVGIAVLLAQGLFVFCLLGLKRDSRGIAAYAALATGCGLLFSPWLAYLLAREGGFNTANFGWIRNPGAVDHVAFLWRDFFWGMSTAGGRWWWLSMAGVACIAAVLAWELLCHRASSTGDGRSRLPVAYLAWLVLAPAFVAAVLSWAYRPVYFRPRFSTMLLHPFLALCALALCRIRRPWLRTVTAAAPLLLMAWGAWSQYHTDHKTDWRELARAWRDEGPPDRILFFPAHDYAPAMHYIRPPVPVVTRAQLQRERVELRGSAAALAGRTLWICSRPGYDFRLPGEAEFHGWLRSLGEVRGIPMRTGIVLERVLVRAQGAVQ
jgi:4-amino-4-deoxy-L-arabinose transferase-like glycosyltransferase